MFCHSTWHILRSSFWRSISGQARGCTAIRGLWRKEKRLQTNEVRWSVSHVIPSLLTSGHLMSISYLFTGSLIMPCFISYLFYLKSCHVISGHPILFQDVLFHCTPLQLGSCHRKSSRLSSTYIMSVVFVFFIWLCLMSKQHV